ncbi:MAG TPA: beta-propeller fold lactonase family protein [Candidatus Acidoferrum sp.]|jgi:6-phosphogluconolactonase|nr:beta-propeller fold lactonase family protein [Candidatus Acidoferrum sp.]
MLQKALVLFFVLTSIAGFIGCGSTSSHYVYATIPAASQIVVYREDPNSGVLTQISGSPYAVGQGAISLVLHPSGKFLYVANPGIGGTAENDISLFTIARDGTLTEVTPRTSVAPSASQPKLLIMDPAGSFLYVMNTGSDNISVFSVDSGSGALTEVGGSPFLIGALPLNMQLAPSGNFLYVSLASQPNGLIATFSVTAGQLTLLGTASTDGINPYGLAINSAGTYLYAANSSTSNSIAVFPIDSSGLLAQQVQGSPINDGYTDPVAMIFDPSGKYLYVANQVSNNVAAYSISSTGLPNALTSSTTTNAFSTESSPSFLATDPSGKYLLVGNQGASAGIQLFSISNGSLSARATYGVGNTPSSIAVLQ